MEKRFWQVSRQAQTRQLGFSGGFTRPKETLAGPRLAGAPAEARHVCLAHLHDFGKKFLDLFEVFVEDR